MKRPARNSRYMGARRHQEYHLSNDATGLVAARAGALEVSGRDVELLNGDDAAGLVGAGAGTLEVRGDLDLLDRSGGDSESGEGVHCNCGVVEARERG